MKTDRSFYKRWYIIPRNRWFHIFVQRADQSYSSRVEGATIISISIGLWGSCFYQSKVSGLYYEFCAKRLGSIYDSSLYDKKTIKYIFRTGESYWTLCFESRLGNVLDDTLNSRDD